MKRTAITAALGSLVITVSACTGPASAGTSVSSTPVPSSGAETDTMPLTGPTGAEVKDSFGNVDYYTTVEGDTFTELSRSFSVSATDIASFNHLPLDVSLRPRMKLRLMPLGPVNAATGPATLDSNGIPRTYTVVWNDLVEGIAVRFGISRDQLAEANKVPSFHDSEDPGVPNALRPGMVLQLQIKQVDARSGVGEVLTNFAQRADYYTTVDGDSLDSIGYKFRISTDRLLRFNPRLQAGAPIPANTKISLMAGSLKIPGAQGTFTTDATGLPLTYTTAPGDTEDQVAARFNLESLELIRPNRPLRSTPGAGYGAWYNTVGTTFELLPGQTISLTTDHPINK